MPSIVPDEDLQRAKELYEAGASTTEIGERLHVSRSAALNYARRAGAKIRPVSVPKNTQRRQEVLKLRDEEGMSFYDIAGRMDITISGARTLYRRAKTGQR